MLGAGWTGGCRVIRVCALVRRIACSACRRRRTPLGRHTRIAHHHVAARGSSPPRCLQSACESAYHDQISGIFECTGHENFGHTRSDLSCASSSRCWEWMSEMALVKVMIRSLYAIDRTQESCHSSSSPTSSSGIK
jgi:hypothetical protein